MHPPTQRTAKGFPRLLKLTKVPLLLSDVPLSTFVSVGSALLSREAKGIVNNPELENPSNLP